MLEEDSQVICGLADTIDTLASHRIDEVVRVLTLITMITLPTTVLSTIYSMNVPMPGNEHPLTFYFVLVLGITVPIFLFWWLRRRGHL